MKKLFLVLIALPIIANADVICTTDSSGNRYCSGTTSNGESVSLSTTRDSSGNSYTSGSVGGRSVSQSCTSTGYSTYCN